MTTFDDLKNDSVLARIEAQNEKFEYRLIQLERRVQLIESAMIRDKMREIDTLLLDVKKLQSGANGGFWEVK